MYTYRVGTFERADDRSHSGVNDTSTSNNAVNSYKTTLLIIQSQLRTPLLPQPGDSTNAGRRVHRCQKPQVVGCVQMQTISEEQKLEKLGHEQKKDCLSRDW